MLPNLAHVAYIHVWSSNGFIPHQYKTARCSHILVFLRRTNFVNYIDQRWFSSEFPCCCSSFSTILHVKCYIMYFFLMCMLGYIVDEQLHHKYHLMTLGVQVRLLITWHVYVPICYEVHAFITQWSTSWLKCTLLPVICSRISFSCILKCKHTTLVISMLENLFSFAY